MQGFVIFDYAQRYPEARQELAQWLAEGKIQRKETIIKGGLAKAEGALLDLFDGANTGQCLLTTLSRRNGSFRLCADTKGNRENAYRGRCPG